MPGKRKWTTRKKREKKIRNTLVCQFQIFKSGWDWSTTMGWIGLHLIFASLCLFLPRQIWFNVQSLWPKVSHARWNHRASNPIQFVVIIYIYVHRQYMQMHMCVCVLESWNFHMWNLFSRASLQNNALSKFKRPDGLIVGVGNLATPRRAREHFHCVF